MGPAALTGVTKHGGSVEGAAGEPEGAGLRTGVVVAGSRGRVVVVLEPGPTECDTPRWGAEAGAAGDREGTTVHQAP